MAQQRQGRRGEIQAIKAATETLAYFKFRFLRRLPKETTLLFTRRLNPHTDEIQNSCNNSLFHLLIYVIDSMSS